MLPVAGVDDLAEVIEQAVRGVGTANERRRFLGHLTLARLGKRARPHRSVGRLFDASFEVGEIALVASSLTDTGSVYVSGQPSEAAIRDLFRSEERRVGKECRKAGRSRWSPYH